MINTTNPVINAIVCGTGWSPIERIIDKEGFSLERRGLPEVFKSISDKKDVTFVIWPSKENMELISTAQSNGYSVNYHLVVPEDIHQALNAIRNDEELIEDHGKDYAEREANDFEKAIHFYPEICKSANSVTLYNGPTYLYHTDPLEVIGKYDNGKLSEGISIESLFQQRGINQGRESLPVTSDENLSPHVFKL